MFGFRSLDSCAGNDGPPFFCGAFTLLDLEWFPQNGVFTDVFPDPPVCTSGLLSVACWSPPLLSLSTIMEAGNLSPCGRGDTLAHTFFIYFSRFRCYYVVGLMHATLISAFFVG